MNKKPKVYCNNCAHYRRVEYYGPVKYCLAISRKVNTFEKEVTQYGNPEILNKKNNCKLFEQKPPTPKPAFWESNGFWVLPLSIAVFVAIVVAILCVFVASK